MQQRQKFIYLDNAATTPISQPVLSAMLPFLSDGLLGANPSSTHYAGRQVQQAWQEALENIRHQLKAGQHQIIVTSGATESINLALKGVMLAQPQHKRHLITSTVEHKATLQVVGGLQKSGIKVTQIAPDAQGQIRLEAIKQAILPETALVSLLWVNNETGTCWDIPAISQFLRERKILLHVDATQAIPRLEICAESVDLLSMSGHKLYAPKGIGLLIKRQFPRIEMQALIEGGGSQYGLRAGTYPVASLIGLSCAVEQAVAQLPYQQLMAQRTAEKILTALSPLGVTRNGGVHCVDSILNLHLPNVLAEALMAATPELGYSAGSACSASHPTPSHVLLGFGLSVLAAKQCVRLSPEILDEETVVQVCQRLVSAISHLQAIALGQKTLLDKAELIFNALPVPVYEALCQPELSYGPIISEFDAEWLEFQHQDDDSEMSWKLKFKGLQLIGIETQLMACPYAIYLWTQVNKALQQVDFASDITLGREWIQHILDQDQVIWPAHKLSVRVRMERWLAAIDKARRVV